MDVAEVVHNELSCVDWDMVVLECFLDELMGDGTICIGKIQPHNSQVLAVDSCRGLGLTTNH